MRHRLTRHGAARLLGGLVLVGALVLMVLGVREQLRIRRIASGFAFLSEPAGFTLSETLLPLDLKDSYAQALLAGLGNSMRVALAACVLATLLGLVVGLGRTAAAPAWRRACGAYVETIRNLPVVLQLMLWYALLIGAAPPLEAPRALGAGMYLSKGGLALPAPIGPAALALGGLGLAGMLLALAWLRRASAPRSTVALACVSAAVLAVLAWSVPGAYWSLPTPRGLSLAGGWVLSPEFLALALGLGMYGSSYIAEVIRAAVQAVPRGQWEACAALGLNRVACLRRVILPQAVRSALPPLTGQYLNLMKNSSLGVVVGYPDLVGVANTAMNQTGQAIECIAIIMVVFLGLNLLVARTMTRSERWAPGSAALP